MQSCVINMDREPGQKTVTKFGGLQIFLSSVDNFVQYFNYMAVL